MDPTPSHIDALKELINIGVGRAAAVLNGMVDSHVSLQVPVVEIVSISELQKEIAGDTEKNLSAVRLRFSGAFSGVSSLIFPSESAVKLVAVLTGEQSWSSDLDSIRGETLNEVGNILLNGVMGSIGNVLERHIDYSLPQYLEDTPDELLSRDCVPSSTILCARTYFIVEELQIEGHIVLFFEVESFDALLAAIDSLGQ